MKYIQVTKLFEDGEYEAILREMEVWPTCFHEGQTGWQKYGDQPVCDVELFFEIPDGSPEAAHRSCWLTYREIWPDPDSALDRMVRMVEGSELSPLQPAPRITSLPIGHRFRVRVKRGLQTGGGEVFDFCAVTEILGLAEPTLARCNPHASSKESDLRDAG